MYQVFYSDFLMIYNQNDLTVESHESGLLKQTRFFALDQSLLSFQGETNMFSASLSITSFDKKSGRGYHWTMFPGRLIHCKSSESRICICN